MHGHRASGEAILSSLCRSVGVSLHESVSSYAHARREVEILFTTYSKADDGIGWAYLSHIHSIHTASDCREQLPSSAPLVVSEDADDHGAAPASTAGPTDDYSIGHKKPTKDELQVCLQRLAVRDEHAQPSNRVCIALCSCLCLFGVHFVEENTIPEWQSLVDNCPFDMIYLRRV